MLILNYDGVIVIYEKGHYTLIITIAGYISRASLTDDSSSGDFTVYIINKRVHILLALHNYGPLRPERLLFYATQETLLARIGEEVLED